MAQIQITRRLFALASAIFALLVQSPAACAQDRIRIGHYGSLTGSEATFGQSTSSGILLAIKEFNDAGGLNGKPIELISYDTKGEVKEATLAVTRLVQSDHVLAVLGEDSSGLSLAGGAVCQAAGVPMVTPSSTHPRVTQIGDMIFRVCFVDSFQGFVCAKFARERLKARKAAILFDQKATYSVGLAQEFKQHFTRAGGTIAAEKSYTGGDADFSQQLTDIRSSAADLIFLPGYYTDVGNIALQARKLGLRAPLLGGDGWDSAQLGKIAGSAIVDCCYSNHYAADRDEPRVRSFITRYRAANNGATPDSGAALGYDAACVLLDALRRSRSLAGREIRDALAATRDFTGVTGTITIDEKRNARKPAVIVRMQGDPPTPRFETLIEAER